MPASVRRPRAGILRVGVLGRRLRRDRRGGALLEFAIVLPVFLLLIFGAIDVIMLHATYASMLSGARDGTRLLALHAGDAAEAEAITRSRLFGAGPYTVDVEEAGLGPDDVAVVVSIPFQHATVTGILGLVGEPLTTRVVMRAEPSGRL